MPKNPKVDPTALAPEIVEAITKLNADADKFNIQTARDGLEAFLKSEFKATQRQADYILTQEFDRPLKRCFKPGENSAIVRQNKNGEMIDGLDPTYWSENYGDILPAVKANEGETDLALAAEAAGNLTKQALLVKKYGVERTEKLLRLVGANLGDVKLNAKPGAPKSESNPWRMGDTPEAQAERIGFIRRMGTSKANALAAAAGVDIAGRPLRVTAATRVALAATKK